MSLSSLSASQTKKTIELCLKAGLVPFIQGSPGIGKSFIVKEIAKQYRLKLIDCRLSTMEPVDLTGLPWIRDGKAEFNPYTMFPLEDSPIPKEYDGFLLFLDEFNSASKATQAAAYRLILDREVGQHKLHPRCLIVAAGNKLEDNAIVSELSTAMVSRLINIQMEVNFEDWRDNFAIPNRIDERIVAYLSMYPNKLMEFDPEVNSGTFTCPRTWVFVDKLIKANNNVIDKEIIPALSGAITFEQAAAFNQYAEMYKNLIPIEQIIDDPTLNPPTDNACLWMNLIHLTYKVTEETLEKVLPFIEKMPITFKIVFARSVLKNYPNILMNRAFRDFSITLGNFAFGDD